MKADDSFLVEKTLRNKTDEFATLNVKIDNNAK